jgi:hypothetical protein
LANDPGNTKNILESVEALRFAGCRPLDKTDEMVESVIKSFKNITELASEELENTKQRYTLIRSKISKFKIGKIYDHVAGKPKVTNLSVHSLEKLITGSHAPEIKGLEKNFYKKGIFDELTTVEKESQREPEPLINEREERIISSAENKNETKRYLSHHFNEVKIQHTDIEDQEFINGDEKGSVRIETESRQIPFGLYESNHQS